MSSLWCPSDSSAFDLELQFPQRPSAESMETQIDAGTSLELWAKPVVKGDEGVESLRRTGCLAED